MNADKPNQVCADEIRGHQLLAADLQIAAAKLADYEQIYISLEGITQLLRQCESDPKWSPTLVKARVLCDSVLIRVTKP